MIEIKGKYTEAIVHIDEVEESCIAQIQSMCNHSAFTNPIKIMPDCHAGKGSVIGFTMPLGDMLIANVVGVDINCGMLSINVGPDAFTKLTFVEVEKKIREAIPFGMSTHTPEDAINMEKEFPWKNVNEEVREFLRAFEKKFGFTVAPPVINYEWFRAKCKQISCDPSRAIRSLGTLGSGNHFVEVGKSETTRDYWVTIHSGSRNFGKCICDYWQGVAKKMLDDKRNGAYQERVLTLRSNHEAAGTPELIPQGIKQLREELGFLGITKGMEALEGTDMLSYLIDMVFTQKYADVNRQVMAFKIKGIFKCEEKDSIHTKHNFIDFKDFIIRKGAIRSYVDERMIIPFNMRDGILICEGKSNTDWNFSAPHGAGRVMSRGDAKRKLNMEQFTHQMKGIYTTSVCESTLDEAPNAYKKSELIESLIGDTVTILDRVKPVISMKDRGSAQTAIDRKKAKRSWKKERREAARYKMQEANATANLQNNRHGVDEEGRLF